MLHRSIDLYKVVSSSTSSPSSSLISCQDTDCVMLNVHVNYQYNFSGHGVSFFVRKAQDKCNNYLYMMFVQKKVSTGHICFSFFAGLVHSNICPWYLPS